MIIDEVLIFIVNNSYTGEINVQTLSWITVYLTKLKVDNLDKQTTFNMKIYS